MTSIDIALLTLTCMLTYSFEIVFGLAGTIMMFFIMSFFIPEKTLVIYSTLPQIVVATIGLSRSRGLVEMQMLFSILLYAAVGAIVGYLLFQQFSVNQFHYTLSLAIIAAGIYLVFAPKIIRIKPVIARILDFFAGMAQMLFGISGPIAMTRLMATFNNKTVIRNYAFAFFLSLNLVRFSSYAIDGSLNWAIGSVMLISAPFIIITLWFANHLHFKVNDASFRQIVSWVILLGGIILLFNKPD